MPKQQQLSTPDGVEYLKKSEVVSSLVTLTEPEEDCDSSDSIPTETDMTAQALVSSLVAAKKRGKKKCTEHPLPPNPFPDDIYKKFLKATCLTESNCEDINTGNGAYGRFQIRLIFLNDLKIWYCTPGPGYNSKVCAEIRNWKLIDALDPFKAERMVYLWLVGRYNYKMARQPGETDREWMERIRGYYYGHPSPTERARDFQRFWEFWLQLQNDGGLG